MTAAPALSGPAIGLFSARHGTSLAGFLIYARHFLGPTIGAQDREWSWVFEIRFHKNYSAWKHGNWWENSF